MTTRRHLTDTLLLLALTTLGACRGDPDRAALDLDAVQWDPPDVGAEPNWPVPGVAADSADPRAFARGGGGGAIAIWRRLSSYSETYLKAWRTALESQDDPLPADVVDAFSELAYAVTGPSGFWRKTVAQQWLGCDQNIESPPCRKLAEAEQELDRWDGVQKEIGLLPPERAATFLGRNRQRILAYLDTYVPPTPSASGMRETPFYRSHLAGVLDDPD